VSLVIVDGQIKRPGPDVDEQAPEHLDPDDIADAVYHLTRQPRSAWTFELDVRPSQESW
jgi:NADP-dependent 3-hydroxy acid dehydrogenase YdfG